MRLLLFLLVFSSTIIISCKSPKEQVMVKFTGETQGTYYAITYFDSKARNFQPQVDSLLREFDMSVSLWEPKSILSRINRNDTSIKTDHVFTEVFKKSLTIFERSQGAFDPTVGPLVNAWGFSFSDRIKVNQHIIDSLLPLVGYDKVILDRQTVKKSDPRIQLDFNAIAQGYAVDLIGDFLFDQDISNFLIDIGGEVLAKGRKPAGENWKVGIEKPKDNASYGEGLQAIVALEDKALATSGNYRKFYEENGQRYSHTIDPSTGYPVNHTLLSASVLADDCATADGWATVCMVLGLEKSKDILKNEKGLEGYFIFSGENGVLETYSTEGFKKLLVDVEE
jgi:FAD:protein FMN transferase